MGYATRKGSQRKKHSLVQKNGAIKHPRRAKEEVLHDRVVGLVVPGQRVKPDTPLATQVDLLIGDYAKARQKLGWEPSVRFQELVRMMVDADRERVATEESYL